MHATVSKEIVEQQNEEQAKDTPARRKLQEFVEWYGNYIEEEAMDKVAFKWLGDSNRTAVAKK